MGESRRLSSDELQRHLADLLFASRDLAVKQITNTTPASTGRRRTPTCSECGFIQSDRANNDHDDLCKAGRVFRALKNLTDVVPNTTNERSASSEFSREPARAADEDRPRTTVLEISRGVAYGEPWALGSYSEVLNSQGKMVADPIGTELRIEDDEPYMRRIVACVNACAGIPTERLERALAEVV